MDKKSVIKRIFLVRHGESEGNIDISKYITIGDQNISLTKKGKIQAFKAGEAFADYVETKLSFSDPTIYYQSWRIWESPYLRTRQTTDNFIKGMGDIFPKHKTDRRESPLLIEQHFGLFDGLTEKQQQEKFPAESAHITRLFQQNMGYMARPPQGESRYDVYLRQNLFKETIWRDANHVENLIISSHGLTIRAFCAAFLNNPMEWLDSERNPENCSIQFIEYNQQREAYKQVRYIYNKKENTSNPVKTFRDDLTI